jgi:hypothetical protein
LKEHSELQDKICNMMIIKQFANNCPELCVWPSCPSSCCCVYELSH